MKNKILFVFILVIGLFIIHVPVYSIGANPEPIVIHQKDGTQITVKQKGDEWHHFSETTDGYRLIKNDNRIFEYATISRKGDIIPSGIKANDPNERLKSEKEFVKSLPALSSFKKSEKQPLLKAPQQLFKNNSVVSRMEQVKGSFKLLVILANFNNTETSYTQVDFDEMLNEQNYNSQGSFRDFYLENSNGKFEVNSTVTAWVVLPHNHDYYGPEEKWGEFAYDAVKAAYESGIDFSEYDNDGDGILDGIAIFHQGHGQESTADENDIWSHSWGLSAGYLKSQRTFGGVEVDGYFTQPELNSNGARLASIGVVCHEFGHILGALDFYDTDYEENGEYDGTGDWDLMASGAYNGTKISGDCPAHHNPYTKNIFGWINVDLLSQPGEIEVAPIQNSLKAYRINTQTENEYFLLENRSLQGFDSELPGEGMLIYHVDEDYIKAHELTNDVNAYEHQGMYLKVASGKLNSQSCPFPGSSGITEFDDTTNPSSLSWNEEPTQKSITDIQKIDSLVMFSFMEFQRGIPQRFSADIENDTTVLLSWQRSKEDYPVVIVYSEENIFGDPIDGLVYNTGDIFPGGGKVIYYGDELNSIENQVTSSDLLHFYRIWSNKGDEYSLYLEASITHPDKVYFDVTDEYNNPITDASVDLDELSGVTDIDGKLILDGDFEENPYHVFTIKKEGYEIFKGSIETSDVNTINIQLIEDNIESSMIIGSDVNYKKIELSWNPVINEDFTGYEPFSIQIPNWTFIDVDETPTYGFQEIAFENEGYTGSFIVFDGYDQSFVDQGMVIDSYVGEQFLGCISSSVGDNDDWLISPEIEVTEPVMLTFMARSLTDVYNLDRIRVLVSENGKSIQSFEKISTFSYMEVPAKWTEYSYDLSKYIGKKIYFAINCVSSDAAMLQLDRIRVIAKSEYDQVNIPAYNQPLGISLNKKVDQDKVSQKSLKSVSATQLVGNMNYLIYRDNQLIGINYGMDSTTITDTPTDCGYHSYSVKAVKNSLTSSQIVNDTLIANCYDVNLTFTDGIDPVSGVNVSLNGQTGITDGNGSIIFKGIDKGDWQLGAERDGFRSLITNLNIQDNSEFPLLFELDIDNNKTVVAPNPSFGQFIVQLPDGMDNAIYRISNSSGQLVQSGEKIIYRFIIDLRSEPAGIYILQITHQDGTEKIKLVKE